MHGFRAEEEPEHASAPRPAIRREVSGADFLRPADGQDDVREICIWACNWQAVEIFERCSLQVAGGFRLSYHGITAREILAVLDLLAVPAADRADAFDDVQFMGNQVCAAYNERIAGETR